MDLKEKVKICFRDLGYIHEFPEKLLINPSTNFIWQQFISSIKPKSEVEECRRAIIINRLKSKNSTTTHKFKIPEIEVYNNLKKIQDQIAETRIRIQEKRAKEEHIKTSNKLKYVKMCKLREKIDENKVRKRLLKLKVKQFEKEIGVTDEMLAIQGLSHVPFESSLSPKTIKEFLESFLANIDKNQFSGPETVSNCLNQDKIVQNSSTVKGKSLGLSLSFDQSDGLLPDHCFEFKDDEEFLLLSPKKENVFPLKTLKNDNEETIQNLKLIFNKTNKEILWNILENIRENVLDNIKFDLKKINFEKNDVTETDFATLNFVIIKNNLLAIKARKTAIRLRDEIRKKKLEIEYNSGALCVENLEKRLDNIRQQATFNFLENCLNNLEDDDVYETRTKLENTQTNLNEKIECEKKKIAQLFETKNNLFAIIEKCKVDSVQVLEKIGKFVWGAAWAEILTQNLHSKEMEIFNEFPLELNRTCKFTSGKKFTGDIFKNLSDEDLVKLVKSIPGCPQSRPELILNQLAYQKIHLNALQTLNNPTFDFVIEKVPLEELENKEKYVEEFCEKLNILIRSKKSLEINKIFNQIKQSVDLWFDMPFKRFISKEVDGRCYQDYENEVLNK